VRVALDLFIHEACQKSNQGKRAQEHPPLKRKLKVHPCENPQNNSNKQPQTWCIH
jgi:hypothetical protein